MNNYFNIRGESYSLYFKTGRPFKNNGLGLVWNELISNEKLSVSMSLEGWDQDIFGRGFAAEFETDLDINERMALLLHTGYKTQDYVLGKQVPSGFNLGLGLRFQKDH
jgi:hypothetical protein